METVDLKAAAREEQMRRLAARPEVRIRFERYMAWFMSGNKWHNMAQYDRAKRANR